MRRGLALAVVALMALISYGAFAADEKADKEKADKEKKEVAFCPVGGIGHEINEKVVVEFEGGKVHFCCDKCPPAFKKNPEKFAANARHQLVATGQLEQVACPISGRPVNEEHKTEVAGLEVGFCCPNCKGKVEKIKTEEEQVAVVFKDISKSFKPPKKESKDTKDEKKS